MIIIKLHGRVIHVEQGFWLLLNAIYHSKGILRCSKHCHDLLKETTSDIFLFRISL